MDVLQSFALKKRLNKIFNNLILSGMPFFKVNDSGMNGLYLLLLKQTLYLAAQINNPLRLLSFIK